MQVKVNEQYNFEVEATDDQAEVDGRKIEFDRRILSDTHTHFIYRHRSYNVEIVSENKASKTCQVKVNGNLYDVKMEDQYDQLLEQLGMDSARQNQVKEIKAPMPGLVLSVLTEAGAEVDKGDSLLILEAMKMENNIKSPVSGRVKKINIARGDKVEKNEILIEFE